MRLVAVNDERKTILLSLAALLVSYWVSSAIYEFLIVPQLGSVVRVSIFWWVIQFSPIILVAVIAGYVLKDSKALLSVALVVAIVFAVFDYIKVVLYFSGHIKSPYLEGSVEEIAKHVMFDFTTLFIALGIGWLGAKVIKRKPLND